MMRTSTAVLTTLLTLLTANAEPALARGMHDHGERNTVSSSEAGLGGHQRGNSAYANAKVEERDRLLGRLKSICRGC